MTTPGIPARNQGFPCALEPMTRHGSLFCKQAVSTAKAAYVLLGQLSGQANEKRQMVSIPFLKQTCSTFTINMERRGLKRCKARTLQKSDRNKTPQQSSSSSPIGAPCSGGLREVQLDRCQAAEPWRRSFGGSHRLIERDDFCAAFLPNQHGYGILECQCRAGVLCSHRVGAG